MNITDIVWLIFGGILFAAGFLIPEKQKKHEVDISQEEEKLKAFLEQEMEDLKTRVSGMSEETSQYTMEKAERFLERLTNEKMMAINEYSDTVLKEINRNHEEVMFLYDMLNDKHANLKNTAKEVEKSAREAKETAQDARIAVDEAQEKAKQVMESVNEASEERTEHKITPLASKKVEDTEHIIPTEKAVSQERTAPVEKTSAKKKTSQSGAKRTTKATEEAKRTTEAAAVSNSGVDIRFAEEDDRANNNEKILKLHKAGKSNMAIARELGLGIGEVKLVIDLFEGM